MVDNYHSDQLKELLTFQINRGIVNLYKKYFLIIQDLKQEHEVLLEKVAQETSPDFPQKIDYFTEDKYNYIRKKILDAGNDSIRELEKTLEVIEVRFKEEK
jgi:hypothetical protein